MLGSALECFSLQPSPAEPSEPSEVKPTPFKTKMAAAEVERIRVSGPKVKI